MLIVKVTMVEGFDEKTQMFVPLEVFELKLEHSLVSLSKWESSFEKPFLGPTKKTAEEALGYIKVMVQNDEVPPEVYAKLSDDNIKEINAYIEAPMTATIITDLEPSKTKQEIITAEIIYHWMIALNVPVQFEHWHLNRLIMLIRVCNLKNEKPKKMSSRKAGMTQAELNAKRKAQLGTTG